MQTQNVNKQITQSKQSNHSKKRATIKTINQINQNIQLQ
jgi:hypothetical protein